MCLSDHKSQLLYSYALIVIKSEYLKLTLLLLLNMSFLRLIPSEKRTFDRKNRQMNFSTNYLQMHEHSRETFRNSLQMLDHLKEIPLTSFAKGNAFEGFKWNFLHERTFLS